VLPLCWACLCVTSTHSYSIDIVIWVPHGLHVKESHVDSHQLPKSFAHASTHTIIFYFGHFLDHDHDLALALNLELSLCVDDEVTLILFLAVAVAVAVDPTLILKQLPSTKQGLDSRTPAGASSTLVCQGLGALAGTGTQGHWQVTVNSSGTDTHWCWQPHAGSFNLKGVNGVLGHGVTLRPATATHAPAANTGTSKPEGCSRHSCAFTTTTARNPTGAASNGLSTTLVAGLPSRNPQKPQRETGSSAKPCHRAARRGHRVVPFKPCGGEARTG
jgi:hypothetical protein